MQRPRKRIPLRVEVDAALCNGCGICEVVCPEVFRMDGEGQRPVAVVLQDVVPLEAMNFCIDARDCCKPNAIRIGNADVISPAGRSF